MVTTKRTLENMAHTCKSIVRRQGDHIFRHIAITIYFPMRHYDTASSRSVRVLAVTHKKSSTCSCMNMPRIALAEKNKQQLR